MRSRFCLTILLLISAAVFATCRSAPDPEQETCEALLATPLRGYIGQEVTAETFAEAIKEAYGVQQVSIAHNQDGSWFVGWFGNGLGYGAVARDGITLTRIGIEYEGDGVSVRRLLDCLHSQPEWYWAAYGSNPPTVGIRYAFDFYFPALGVVATGTGAERRRATPPPLTIDSHADRLFVGQAGSLASLYEQRWEVALGDARPGLHPLPWPGEWDDLRYAEDHGAGW